MLKKKLIITALILSVYLTACCSNKAQTEKTVKGYITVVGHEPFAKLAVKLADNKIFILKCEKDLEAKLLKQQGNSYIIEYSEIKDEIEGHVLIVEKAIPLSNETTK
jgi:hypothetical protein